MAESFDVLSGCPECKIRYQVWGKHAPRLLPCGHGLCNKCIESLTKEDQSRCSVCWKEHLALDGANCFPLNMFVIEYLQKNRNSEFKNAKCMEHGKELNLFCKQIECCKVICQMCLIKDHMSHGKNVMDITEFRGEQKQEFLSSIENLNGKYNQISGRLELAEEMVTQNKNEIFDFLKTLQAEVVKTVAGVETVALENINKIGEIRRICEEKVQLLNNTMQALEVPDEVDIGQCMQNMAECEKYLNSLTTMELNTEKLNVLDENIVTNLTCFITYPLGAINLMRTSRKRCVENIEERSPGGEDRHPAHSSKRPHTAVENKWKVSKTIPVNFRKVASVIGFEDTVVLLCGENNCCLIEFNLENGHEIQRVVLNEYAHSLVDVLLGGKQCVAVFYEWFRSDNTNIIEFRDKDKLETVILNWFYDNQAYCLCNFNPSVLCYETVKSCGVSEIRKLDCSVVPPTLEDGGLRTRSRVSRMCCLKKGELNLLLAVYECRGLETYNMQTGELIWMYNDTTFVTDVAVENDENFMLCYNEGVHRINKNGLYTGKVIGTNSFDEVFVPQKVYFHGKTSDFYVAHKKNRETNCFISILKV